MKEEKRIMEEKKCNVFHLECEGKITGNKTFEDLKKEYKMSDVESFDGIMGFMRHYYSDKCAECSLTSAELLEILSAGTDLFESQAKVYDEKRKVYDAMPALRDNILENICANAMFVVARMDNAEQRDRAFCALTEEMFETFKRKNHDYGNSFEKSLDKFGLVAAACRMGDKMNRIVSLTADKAHVKDESVRDTLLDLANYAVMTMMWILKIADSMAIDGGELCIAPEETEE